MTRVTLLGLSTTCTATVWVGSWKPCGPWVRPKASRPLTGGTENAGVAGVFPGTPAALGDAGRDDRSSAEFGFAGFASLCMAREVSDSGDSVVRTVWPAEAGRPSVCRVAGVGPSTAGVGPVTAVSEHAASRTHASTTTGTSVPILTPSALTTPATVPGPVGARCVEPCHREKTRRNLPSVTPSTTVFSSANRNHCLGPWLDSSERAPRPSASRISSHQGPRLDSPRKTPRPSSQPHPSHHRLRATASVEHEITIARARRE